MSMLRRDECSAPFALPLSGFFAARVRALPAPCPNPLSTLLPGPPVRSARAYSDRSGLSSRMTFGKKSAAKLANWTPQKKFLSAALPPGAVWEPFCELYLYAVASASLLLLFILLLPSLPVSHPASSTPLVLSFCTIGASVQKARDWTNLVKVPCSLLHFTSSLARLGSLLSLPRPSWSYTHEHCCPLPPRRYSALLR